MAFKSNERLFHMDMILKQIDPNIIINTRESNYKDNLKLKILQALVLNDIDNKNNKQN